MRLEGLAKSTALIFIVILSIDDVILVAAERVAFSLAENEPNRLARDVRHEKPSNSNSFSSFIEGLKDNVYIKDLLQIFHYFADSENKKPKIRQDSTKIKVPMAQDDAPLMHRKAFETSLSLDETPEAVSRTGDIKQQDYSSILFGERGVLTGIFQVLDQQKKQSMRKVQSDTKIHGELNFQKIFDDLLVGSEKGELGETGQALPEAISFLGICNRLSCGDIYKAIDQFRKSDFFSNFQTALTLMQDPNGWETLGKLLSNPELIAQFAGAGGSEMGEVFGSALGQAKKESEQNKDRNKGLVPEDGDFGTDFSEPKKGPKKDEKPEIDFSIDAKGARQTKGGSEDYYSENDNMNSSRSFFAPSSGEDTDLVDYEVRVDEKMPEVTAASTSTTLESKATTTTPIPNTPSESLVINPNTMIIDKKEKERELPPISFSIDKDQDFEDIIEGESVSANVDSLPPSTKIESSVDSSGSSIAKTDETVIRHHKVAGRFGQRATTLTFLFPKRRALTTTPKPEIIRRPPSTIPSINMNSLPRQEPVSTTTMLILSSTTHEFTTTTTTTTTKEMTTSRPRRLNSRRSTPRNRPTTTMRNFRKDSDYYAMYYDNN